MFKIKEIIDNFLSFIIFNIFLISCLCYGYFLYKKINKNLNNMKKNIDLFSNLNCFDNEYIKKSLHEYEKKYVYFYYWLIILFIVIILITIFAFALSKWLISKIRKNKIIKKDESN